MLAEILPESRSLDGSSNKFSGDVVIDFDPRHVKQMRLVIADRVGDARISLRSLSFYARQYATVGLLTSKRIDSLDLGFVNFNTVQRVAEELTSLTHQISYDGVHYTSVTPGTQFDLGGKPFWYRSYLERLDSNFDLKAAPVAVPGQDPDAATYYKVKNVLAVDVGNNILERSISLDLYAGFSRRITIVPKCIWKRCKSVLYLVYLSAFKSNSHVSRQDFEVFGTFLS